MSEPFMGRWAPAGSPLAVEYPVQVMDRIRALASDGFTMLARGGIEVGGVLFGRQASGKVEIAQMRPVECTFARSPLFTLAGQNRARFEQVVQSAASDPSLAGLQPVGWYVSHSRADLRMTETDREIFADYFPHPWQVTLVLRPGRAGSVRAGFFLRSRGTTVEEWSLLEFNLDPLVESPGSGAAPVQDAPAPLVRPVLPTVRRSRKWPIVLAWCLLVACGAGAGWWFLSKGPAEPVSLQVRENDGVMLVEWNRNSQQISTASGAILEISDKGEKRPIRIPPAQLGRGTYAFLRKGADVGIRMRISGPDGKETVESASYLGIPVKPAEPAPRPAPADWENEKASLGEDLRASQEEVQVLRRRVAELENLLRIERNRSEVFRRK